MRVCLVAPTAMPLGRGLYGGVELLVSTWADALTHAGHSVTVIAPKGSVVPNGVRLIQTLELPQWQDRDDISENIARLSMRDDDFDVIHDFSHKNAFKDTAIHMVWNPISVYYGSTAKKRQVTLSRWQAERFEKLYKQKSITMPMWVDTDRVKPAEAPARERLLHFGAIIPAKGANLAIDYATKLGVPLDVAGGVIPSEEDSPYIKTIKQKCDGERMRLHFNVTEEEKLNLLQNALAVVYPVQQAEAHWLTGMESWCCITEDAEIVADDIYRSHKRFPIQETIEIESESGRKLNMTPNHPILTQHGWVESASLHMGDTIFISKPNFDTRGIEDLYEEVARHSITARVLSDGRSTSLSCRLDRWGRNDYDKISPSQSKERQAKASFFNTLHSYLQRIPHPNGMVDGAENPNDPLLQAWRKGGSISIHGEGVGSSLTTVAETSSISSDKETPSPNSNSVHSRQTTEWISSITHGTSIIPSEMYKMVEPETIIQIRRRNTKGVAVYNFTTGTGLYLANGILVHNCGTPTLAYDIGAMKEITRTIWGSVVDGSAAFVSYMAKFVDDKNFRKGFGSPESAWSAFSKDAVMEEWLDLYDRVSKGFTW